jgi:hypothetical protein
MKKSIIFSFLATCFFLQEGEAKWCRNMSPKQCNTREGALNYLRNKCNYTHDCMMNYIDSMEWIDGRQNDHEDWGALEAEVRAETDRSFRAR